MPIHRYLSIGICLWESPGCPWLVLEQPVQLGRRRRIPSRGHGTAAPLNFGSCAAGPRWFGSEGRGSLRARRRLGMASPPPTPFPAVWGSGDGQGMLPCPSSPPLVQQKRGNPERHPCCAWGGMNSLPSWGMDPGPSSLGSFGVPSLGLPCPQARLRTPQHKENPRDAVGNTAGRDSGTVPTTTAAHRGPCCGCHPRPGLTKGSCHAFRRHFPKQTSHLFTGRQWS